MVAFNDCLSATTEQKFKEYAAPSPDVNSRDRKFCFPDKEVQSNRLYRLQRKLWWVIKYLYSDV